MMKLRQIFDPYPTNSPNLTSWLLLYLSRPAGLSLNTSGVARGSGARGQGILTAPPKKSFEIFFLPSQKSWFLSLKNFWWPFLVITQFFLINHYNTRVLRPLYPNNHNDTPHFAPLYKLYYKISIFPPSLRNIYPNFRELLWKSFKNTFLGTDFSPPLALRHRTTVPLPPSLRHCSILRRTISMASTHWAKTVASSDV